MDEVRIHESCAAVIKRLRELDLTFEESLAVLNSVATALQRTVHQKVSVELDILETCIHERLLRRDAHF